MPKFITFAVAEKGLLTKEGTVSLIILLQQVDVRIQADKDSQGLPKNAVAPINWCAYSLWQQEAGDEGVEFTKNLQILWPDKSEFMRHHMKFKFTEKKNHNVLMNISGFPVGQTGPVTINMWLETQSQRVSATLSWTVEVTHKPPNEPKQETSSVN